MKPWIAGLTLILLAGTASAEGTNKKKPPPEPEPMPAPTQIQEQAQDQAAYSDAVAKALAGAASGSESSVMTGDTNANLEIQDNSAIAIEGDDVRYDFPVNTAYAPTAWSWIKCDQVFGIGSTTESNSWSLGLPIPRWLSVKQRDCELVQYANSLAQLGMIRASFETLCGAKGMYQLHGANLKNLGKQAQINGCVLHLSALRAEETGLLVMIRQQEERIETLETQITTAMTIAREQIKRCEDETEQCLSK